MSGGSYDYLYQRVTDMAHTMQHSDRPLRKAFGVHLLLIASAMHDVEWVDSADYGSGDEDEAIRACLPADAELRAATTEAERIAGVLGDVLASACAELEDK